MSKKKKLLIAIVFLVLGGFIGLKCFCAKIVQAARTLEDVPINMSDVRDGIYDGHSALGPVNVDVRVTVEAQRIKSVEIIKHDNGFGGKANIIVDDIVANNTYDVDAVSGATVSSEVIMNAVNNALLQGL